MDGRIGEPGTIPQPVVARVGWMDMQVCVPMEWTDAQVVVFAEVANPCGTRSGWSIRREGNPLLGGAGERVLCDDRMGCVHIVLDA